MATSDLDDARELLSLLECPVCLELMKPPIVQCSNGHSVCSKCKGKLTVCPSCQADYLLTRNLLAEQMAYKVKHPCKNQSAGCSEKYPLEHLTRHEAECPHRVFECKAGFGVKGVNKCGWSGLLDQLYHHVAASHKPFCWMRSSNTIQHKNIDLSQDSSITQLVSAHDEIFWYHYRHVTSEERSFIALQYIGQVKAAKKYKYEVKCSSSGGGGGGDFDLSMVCPAHGDPEDAQAIFQTGKCLILDFRTMHHFIANKAFIMKLNVLKT